MTAEPGYTHQVLPAGTVRVLYDTGDVLYSPPVPRWPWEVVHNYGQVVVGDQYCARHFVRPGMYVLDVGASFGTFTLLACKLGAKPVAIEPIHENVKCLELLRSRQGYEFEIVETAAGHYRGTAVISCSLDSISGGSFIVEGAVADNAKLIEIPIDTIDSVVAGLVTCPRELRHSLCGAFAGPRSPGRRAERSEARSPGLDCLRGRGAVAQ